MIARMALPKLGGAPAVWNSAMLVYQALLLAGYAYAHWLSTKPATVQVRIHLLGFALAALWLPLSLSAVVPAADSAPIFSVPWFLLSSIGPLFFIVSAQAPLMQRWYAMDPERGNPYPLYAASNIGSFAGLLAYPLIVEPLMPLRYQSLSWSMAYIGLAALVGACFLMTPRPKIIASVAAAAPKLRRSDVVRWVVLAAVPSGLILSTTTHLTTDVVAIPLLWVLPLGLYLLSYVVAFSERRGAASVITAFAPLVLVVGAFVSLSLFSGPSTYLWSAAISLAVLFAVAVAMHAELYRLKPDASKLTAFYLAISTGGMIGGAFCAVVAPLLFDWTYEHLLLLALAAYLVPQHELRHVIDRFWPSGRRGRLLALLLPGVALMISAVGFFLLDGNFRAELTVTVILGMLAVVCLGRPLAFAGCIVAALLASGGWDSLSDSINRTRVRSYFGIYTVKFEPSVGARILVHGTTLHGMQFLDAKRLKTPTSYYTPRGGAGIAALSAERLFGPSARIAVVGLGAGTLGCYARPGQQWSFFEIDPAVVAIATDRKRFRFLSDCVPDARIFIGDARLTLEKQRSDSYDLMFVDAFSSDAIPMHLITIEAFRLYGRVLSSEGLLLFHVSNKFVDLKPVVADAVARQGWHAIILEDTGDRMSSRGSSRIAISRDQQVLSALPSGAAGAKWSSLKPRPGFVTWTDEFASIMPVLKL